MWEIPLNVSEYQIETKSYKMNLTKRLKSFEEKFESMVKQYSG